MSFPPNHFRTDFHPCPFALAFTSPLIAGRKGRPARMVRSPENDPPALPDRGTRSAWTPPTALSRSTTARSDLSPFCRCLFGTFKHLLLVPPKRAVAEA
jgi:hypothetical protein